MKIKADKITPNSWVISEKGKYVQITTTGDVKLIKKYHPTGKFEEKDFAEEIAAKIIALIGEIPAKITLDDGSELLDTPDGVVFEKLKAINFLEVLSKKFTKCEKFAEALRLAVNAGENIIVYGPGGYGKSDMMRELLKAAGVYEDTFIMSFGEDTSETQLWGGMDYKIAGEEGRLVYHTQDSFIRKEISVMEELLDAPVNTLLALKDTLEAKEFRKGSQREPLKTRIVIAFTNKSPQEVEDLGEYARALMSRFRIELYHGWESHKYSDYLELLTKALPGKNIKTIELASQTFEILSREKEISPRIAIAATKLMLQSGGKSIEETLAPLKFVTELARRKDELDKLEIKLISAINYRDINSLYKETMEQVSEMKKTDPIGAIKKLSRTKEQMRSKALDDDGYRKMGNLCAELDKEKENIFGGI